MFTFICSSTLLASVVKEGTHVPDTDLQGTSYGTFQRSGHVVCRPRQGDGGGGIDTPRTQERREVLYARPCRCYEDDVANDSEDRAGDDEGRPAVD